MDMAFPVAYGLLFAIVLSHLFRGPAYLLPIALGAADMAENLAVAALVLSHAGPPSPLAWVAGAFTLVKTVLILGTLGATAVGAARRLSMRFRPPP
ncbi:MAG: hypothetical protein OXN16_06215 [Gammaproteobacteria bacterium]|nr:hypothetical protein [Gammaproteobacteria bacterium]